MEAEASTTQVVLFSESTISQMADWRHKEGQVDRASRFISVYGDFTDVGAKWLPQSFHGPCPALKVQLNSSLQEERASG